MSSVEDILTALERIDKRIAHIDQKLTFLQTDFMDVRGDIEGIRKEYRGEIMELRADLVAFINRAKVAIVDEKKRVIKTPMLFKESLPKLLKPKPSLPK